MGKTWAWVVAPFVGILIGLYTAFVAMNLWNWFAVRALNINSITFLEMVGIVWLISLFKNRNIEDESKWKFLFNAIEACVPDHTREILAATLEEHKKISGRMLS